MSNHKNDLLSLHYAAAAGFLLDARPQQAHAAVDAEPETAERRENRLRRLAGAFRARREAAARALTGRA